MPSTVQEALRRASLQLQAAGLQQPRREAEALLCAMLKRPLAWIYAHGEYVLSAAEETLFGAWVRRRARHEPYAYITGEREFMGLSFLVTRDVLIPRPETEILVETAVALLKEKAEPRILEIGVGSGAVAVSLAVFLPTATVVGVELSAAALEVAGQNARRHQVNERLSFLHGDLYAPVAGRYFDLVVSNPPYIPSVQLPQLAETVKNYEPMLALDGGADGLHFYRRLNGELSQLATPPPFFLLEVGQGQAEPVARLCRQAGFKQIEKIPDLAGIERVILARLEPQ
ncbi:MAG: peptide chain release factor N(5)-glutamine methyltransferase [Firmicutes bacterium]|nr:peptide chain release factor N(5)-glutamine methyltransferase [Bacillota bacterium]